MFIFNINRVFFLDDFNKAKKKDSYWEVNRCPKIISISIENRTTTITTRRKYFIYLTIARKWSFDRTIFRKKGEIRKLKTRPLLLFWEIGLSLQFCIYDWNDCSNLMKLYLINWFSLLSIRKLTIPIQTMSM